MFRSIHGNDYAFFAYIDIASCRHNMVRAGIAGAFASATVLSARNLKQTAGLSACHVLNPRL